MSKRVQVQTLDLFISIDRGGAAIPRTGPTIEMSTKQLDFEEWKYWSVTRFLPNILKNFQHYLDMHDFLPLEDSQLNKCQQKLDIGIHNSVAK